MLEFAYFTVKIVFWIFVIKYVSETIQVVFSGYKASDNSLLRLYLQKKLTSKGFNHRETIKEWKE